LDASLFSDERWCRAVFLHYAWWCKPCRKLGYQALEEACSRAKLAISQTGFDFPGGEFLKNHTANLHRQWSIPIIIVVIVRRRKIRRRIEILRLGRRRSRQSDDNCRVNRAWQLLEPSPQSSAQHPC
jgi:hypothetical protein